MKFAAVVFLAGLIVSLSSPSPTVAQAPRIERLEIIQSGFLTVRRTGATMAAPGSAAGVIVEADHERFLPEPPADAARVGTIFGVKFRVIGEPRNAVVNLRAIWRIPPPGITNPKTENTYRRDLTEFPVAIGEDRIRAFGFDEPWEIVRGIWTLELWQGDRKLLEQNFVIR